MATDGLSITRNNIVYTATDIKDNKLGRGSVRNGVFYVYIEKERIVKSRIGFICTLVSKFKFIFQTNVSEYSKVQQNPISLALLGFYNKYKK